jgi:O-antigen/teichoic acid export membrane protein
LAELGFGTAMNYNLYTAIYDEDIEKIKSLMAYYKKVYISIGCIILCAGGAITPFIPFLVSKNVVIEVNLYVIFILYVVNTASTYFFSYRTAYINANQMRRVVDFYTILFSIVREILSVAILYYSNNFYAYILCQILVNVALYLFLHHKSSILFPYLDIKDSNPLTKEEKRGIYQNIRALIIYKVASVILGSTDNILISVMLDTVIVGILSNYTLITNAIKNLINKVIHGYFASLGIANASKTNEQKYELFKMFRIVLFWGFGYVSIGIFLMISDVVRLWLGNEYVLQGSIVFAMSLYFWLEGCGNLTYSFRTTMGLFKESQFAPVVAAILNILFSIILGRVYGVFGILIATSLCRLTTYFWLDPLVIYNKSFKKNVTEYFVYYLKYALVTVLNVYITNVSISLIPNSSILGLISRFIVLTICSNLIYGIYFVRQKEFKLVAKKVYSMMQKFLKKGVMH